MTDILLFGIFHFSEEKIDFTLDEIQNQLDELALAISRFSPTSVAVELDKEKYGAEYSLLDGNWKNEFLREQISLGGRIAINSGLQILHPIDKVLLLLYFLPFRLCLDHSFKELRLNNISSFPAPRSRCFASAKILLFPFPPTLFQNIFHLFSLFSLSPET